MNIVLLSGGSGKRLWPISNEVRSKQFIKLFKNNLNEYESMLQRVFRQIKSVSQDAKIVISTSEAQKSSVKNQLNDQVSICIEPCRRDTFAAIVLATSFFVEKEKLNPEDIITVCPVDPYVSEEYYRAVKELEIYAKKGEANIILMGIEPTTPSNKYGYIIPNSKDKISTVISFKEKPSVDIAKAYINEGAVWNAGVFAFKAAYLLNLARERINYSSYEKLVVDYANLEKISFDYAVVERETSIQVLRYVGEWYDVGTWNMITKVMDNNIKGNVTLDEYCDNTHVINELEIPILCMGGKDLIVAASNDGIFVSTKSRSSEMKKYVEQICTDIRYAEKSWGTYNVIDAQQESITIKISLYAKKHMRYHSHDFRKEVWNVVKGRGKVIIDGISFGVSTGDVIEIPIGTKHKIEAITDMQIIEVQMGNIINIDDKVIYNE